MSATRKTTAAAVGSAIVASCIALAAAGPGSVAPAPNGIELPEGYRSWAVVSISHRADKQSLRAILGNDVAVAAVAGGNTNPWPDGAMLAKVAWEQADHKGWASSIAPGALQHVGLMVKDSEGYAETGGWGYARWLGEDLEPYGADEDFGLDCHACHVAAADNDFVFTRAAAIPTPGEADEKPTE